MKTFTEVRYDLKALQSAQLTELTKFKHEFPDMPHTCLQIEEFPVPDDVTVSAWWGWQWGGALHVTLLNLNSFKDECLVNLLELLDTKFNLVYESQDQPEYFCRTFSGSVEWERGKMDVRVEARVKNDASGCHRIQVGEEVRTVTTPIYKMECQGEENVD